MIYLSICIPTLPDARSRQHFINIMSLLAPQLTEEVEVITDDRDRHIPTGTKRNDMYSKAQGLYVSSVDVDDWISPDYVSEILIAIKNNMPDVVTFDGWYTENGRNHVDWQIKLGEKYEARHDNASGGKYMFFRWPNHLSAMRKEIATRIKFEPIWQGEDYKWSKEIHDKGLLKTEIHIYKQLYHYIYLTTK
jgi:glycosyltransferase involved in cell wall biosynthesis